VSWAGADEDAAVAVVLVEVVAVAVVEAEAEAEAERGRLVFFVVMEKRSVAAVEAGSDDPGSDADRLIPIDGSGGSLPFPTDFEGREAEVESREVDKVCAEFKELDAEIDAEFDTEFEFDVEVEVEVEGVDVEADFKGAVGPRSSVRSPEESEDVDRKRLRVFFEARARFCTSEAEGMAILNPLIRGLVLHRMICTERNLREDKERCCDERKEREEKREKNTRKKKRKEQNRTVQKRKGKKRKGKKRRRRKKRKEKKEKREKRKEKREKRKEKRKKENPPSEISSELPRPSTSKLIKISDGYIIY